jgi:membrane fusion protein (multidrug efflux system)
MLGLIGLGGCKKGEAAAGGGMGGGAEAPPSAVEVAVARTDTVVDAIEATGQVEAIQSIELRPDVEGRIVEIPATEGTEVAAGAALVKIDDQELKAQVAKAEADRDLARQALARTRDLLNQKASSTSDLEKAEATARSTQAELDLLTLRLGRTTVRAPFAGVVGQRLVSLGDYVTTSTRLVSLQTVNPQRVAFTVPERFATRLKRGQRVAFRVASLTGREFEGVVDFVDPVVQLPGRTILIKAVVPNPRRELAAGMFAEARLATEVRPRAVVVPEDALLPLQGAFFVWVSKDSKATRRQVGIGVRTPGFVEVKSGVDAGEQVVVGGQERLFEGATLAPTVVDRTPAVKSENE